MLRVLVTGATGFCGQPVIRALAEAGYEVRALARRPIEPHSDNVEPVIGDLSNGIDWSSLLADVQAVVHLAALTASEGVPDEDFDRINHRATEGLARAAQRAGIEHFIFVSSVSAQSGGAADHPLTETDDPKPENAYGRSKLAAETSVRAAGVPFTILRPVMMYSDAPRGYLARYARIAATPFPLPFGAFRNRRSLLAIENFVSAILFVLRTPAAKAKTFLVADPEPVSLPQILRAFRRGMGRRPLLFSFPAAPLRWAMGGKASELVAVPSKLMAAGWLPVADTETFLARTPRATS